MEGLLELPLLLSIAISHDRIRTKLPLVSGNGHNKLSVQFSESEL
jgi:hypothetical protein